MVSGAVFATSTKSDTVPLSYENLCKICSSVSIPVVAIGGINIENVKSLKDSGISGVAVVSGIFKSDDVRKSAFNLKKTVLDILGE